MIIRDHRSSTHYPAQRRKFSLCLSGYSKDDRNAVRSMVAASPLASVVAVDTEFNPRGVDALLCRTSGTAKYKLARQHKVPIVRYAWVVDSVRLGALQPVTLPQYSVPCLHGVRVCVTGMPPEQRDAVRALCDRLGAVFSPTLTKETDVLVVAATASSRSSAASQLTVRSDKIKMAERWQIPRCSLDWLSQCADKNEWFEPTDFSIPVDEKIARIVSQQSSGPPSLQHPPCLRGCRVLFIGVPDGRDLPDKYEYLTGLTVFPFSTPSVPLRVLGDVQRLLRLGDGGEEAAQRPTHVVVCSSSFSDIPVEERKVLLYVHYHAPDLPVVSVRWLAQCSSRSERVPESEYKIAVDRTCAVVTLTGFSREDALDAERVITRAIGGVVQPTLCARVPPVSSGQELIFLTSHLVVSSALRTSSGGLEVSSASAKLKLVRMCRPVRTLVLWASWLARCSDARKLVRPDPTQDHVDLSGGGSAPDNFETTATTANGVIVDIDANEPNAMNDQQVVDVAAPDDDDTYDGGCLDARLRGLEAGLGFTSPPPPPRPTTTGSFEPPVDASSAKRRLCRRDCLAAAGSPIHPAVVAVMAADKSRDETQSPPQRDEQRSGTTPDDDVVVLSPPPPPPPPPPRVSTTSSTGTRESQVVVFNHDSATKRTGAGGASWVVPPPHPSSADEPVKRFLLSNKASACGREVLAHQIRALGGVVVDNVDVCTHLITHRVSKTETFLSAVAAGRWVLRQDYVVDSYASKAWRSEERYEWSEIESNVGGATSTNDLLTAACRQWRRAGGGAYSTWHAVVVMQDEKRRASFCSVLKNGGAVSVEGRGHGDAGMVISALPPATASSSRVCVFLYDDHIQPSDAQRWLETFPAVHHLRLEALVHVLTHPPTPTATTTHQSATLSVPLNLHIKNWLAAGGRKRPQQ